MVSDKLSSHPKPLEKKNKGDTGHYQCSPLSKICCRTAGQVAGQKVANPAKNSKDMLIAYVIEIF